MSPHHMYLIIIFTLSLYFSTPTVQANTGMKCNSPLDGKNTHSPKDIAFKQGGQYTLLQTQTIWILL